ncbi:MAG: aldehyde dehydrogenase family protein, partial [Burkholderiaceae bacterium]
MTRVDPHQAAPVAATAELTAFINGKFAALEEPYRLPVIDPATELKVGSLQESDAAQVDAAVRAARAAFESGVWSRQSTDRRQACMLR